MFMHFIRNSQWYKSTISPNAKDVVILIHRSNSMASYLLLATEAAQLIIDNLNTGDQVGSKQFLRPDLFRVNHYGSKTRNTNVFISDGQL